MVEQEESITYSAIVLHTVLDYRANRKLALVHHLESATEAVSLEEGLVDTK